MEVYRDVDITDDQIEPDVPIRRIQCLKSAYPYINKTGLKNLNEYKYAGGDRGYAYVYFYNPVATKIVSCLPDYLA